MIDSFEGEYRFLSNFAPSRMRVHGKYYDTAEHFFQSLKTLDPREQEWVRLAPTPGLAKKCGKKVTLRDDWDEVLCCKFLNSILRQQLIDTGDQELIEGNWWGDTYWGVCKGIGQNKLGKLLMKHRAHCIKFV